MKQSLQLRLGQHLTMTPQLQQAIRLLQLSTLELRVEVQQALETNPMLELAEEEEDQETAVTEEGVESERSDRELELQGPDIPDELPVDSSWDDTYENSIAGGVRDLDGGDRPFEFGDSSSESLREHLLWQMRMAPLSETDRQIAEAVIDAVNEDGFLTLPLEEIHQGLDPDLDVDLDEVEAVLHAIQNFDPPGVAARDLRESLVLQLRQLDPDTPSLADTKRLVEQYFELLAHRDFAQLRRRMKLSEEDLRQAVNLIQTLNPRPGSQVSGTHAQYIVPDVTVRKVNGSWRVELNAEASPRLRINTRYVDLIRQVNNPSDSTYMKNHLQEARWFIKSLKSRNETLLKVATSIVQHQQGFLEHGEVAMKALVLHDIAEELGMHESTISRVTTRKYMHTPRGVFELKYFFSSHVSTASGGECSSTAIRALIRNLIAEENPTKPLSDSKIAVVLCEQGINVARRTVAKYREAIAIPPSNERKRLA